MKEIQLNKGQVALVDDADFEFLLPYKWYAHLSNGKYYVRSSARDGHKYLHRLLLNCGKIEYVDHIDGNGLNNQRNNIRKCTQQQNLFNKAKKLNTSSKFKGVSWKKDKNKWKAYINKDRKHMHLGYFKSETDAAEAYDKAAIIYQGEFARLNFKALMAI